MVIGFQIGKLHGGGQNPPPALQILKSPACSELKSKQRMAHSLKILSYAL